MSQAVGLAWVLVADRIPDGRKIQARRLAVVAA